MLRADGRCRSALRTIMIHDVNPPTAAGPIHSSTRLGPAGVAREDAVCALAGDPHCVRGDLLLLASRPNAAVCLGRVEASEGRSNGRRSSAGCLKSSVDCGRVVDQGWTLATCLLELRL